MTLLTVYHIQKKCYTGEMENEEKIENINIAKSKINQNQIAGAIIIAGLLIAGAILLKGNIGSTTNGVADLSTVKIKQVSPDEHILGNPNAKVMIVEYADTECPWCKVFHATMHQVVEKNPNIAWVYRHYPIPQLHPKAKHEAIAAECAYEQGGNNTFWKYVDEIFNRTPSNNKLDILELSKIATDLGLDLVSFNTCLDSEKYKTKVEDNMKEADSLQTQLLAGKFIQNGLGTPASFIIKKGKVVDIIHGAEPLETVMQKIDKVLK
jgi:protein-disulfide isomerase